MHHHHLSPSPSLSLSFSLSLSLSILTGHLKYEYLKKKKRTTRKEWRHHPWSVPALTWKWEEKKKKEKKLEEKKKNNQKKTSWHSRQRHVGAAPLLRPDVRGRRDEERACFPSGPEWPAGHVTVSGGSSVSFSEWRSEWAHNNIDNNNPW